MERDLYAFSKEAFEGIDVKILDARTFLRRTRKKYDLITLLNTYKVQNIGNFGEPDFIHTKEALNEYLDHLDDSGFLLLEERPVNKRAKYAIFRLINNIIHVLKERGSEHPEDHFFIYNWNLTKGKTPMNWYTMIAVKKTPLDESDLDYFKRWLLHHYRREYVVRTSPLHTQIEYLPGEDLKTEYADFMGSDNKDDYFGKGIMLTPTSDDNPYTFDIFAKRSEIKKMLRDMGIICAVIFCAILGILLFSLKKSGTVSSIPFILYFSFLGLGYFIIEIGLLNIYQNFTGSPTNSFIFVLGSLLFSSGIGSYFSGEYSGKKVNCAFIGIILFSLYHLFLSKYVVGLFTFNVLINNLVIALTILPLGFCMGIPFPYGMEKLKRSFGEKYVPVFYAVNCLVSTFAILLGLYLSFVFGFMAAFIFAVVCYLIALIWKNQT